MASQRQSKQLLISTEFVRTEFVRTFSGWRQQETQCS